MSEAIQTLSHFHENILHAVPVTYEALQSALEDLGRAIDKGVAILESQCRPTSDIDDKDVGTIFNGHLGIAITFLRLHSQRDVIYPSTETNNPYSSSSSSSIRNYLELASRYCPAAPVEKGQPQEDRNPNTSVSPITSSVSGPAFIRLLAALNGAAIYSCLEDSAHVCLSELCPVAADLRNVETDVDEALEGPSIIEKNGHKLGRDEVLIGRAGMIWALGCLSSAKDFRETPLVLKDVKLQDKLDAIIRKRQRLLYATASEGSQHVIEYKYEEHAIDVKIPLLWPWLNQYYGLGAMHGATGILANLVYPWNASAGSRNTYKNMLGEPDDRNHDSTVPNVDQGVPDADIKATDLSLDQQAAVDVFNSIGALCDISIRNGGHLPMSLPPFPSKTQRTSPLVQICHGAPGLLALLAIASISPKNQQIWNHEGSRMFRREKWREAFNRTSDIVWKEGLLRKGGGLCHGIAGNAWAWLAISTCDLLQPDHISEPEGHLGTGATENQPVDAHDCLGRALAFLLEARNTRPFVDYDDSGRLSERSELHADANTSEALREYSLPDKPFGLFTGLAGTVAMWSEACVVIRWHMRRLEMIASAEKAEKQPEERFTSLEGLGPSLAAIEQAMLGFPGLS